MATAAHSIPTAPDRIWDQRVPTDSLPADRATFLVPALTVRVSDADDDGVWVASDDFSTVYGDAESPEAAVADYAACLVDQYLWSEQHADELPPGADEELAAFRSRMRPTIGR